MAADDALEVHPQVPVVELVQVPGTGPAGNDDPAPARHEHRDAERLLPDVVENDVRVGAGLGPDHLPQQLPLPDHVIRRTAGQAYLIPVDDDVTAEPPQGRRLLIRPDHSYRYPAAILDELDRVRAKPAGRTPDQHDVALLHAGTLTADQHAVRSARAQRNARGLLPRQVRRLGHQLAGPDHRVLRQAAEVRLVTPGPLLHPEHPVTVRGRLLVINMSRADGHVVADPPAPHPRPGPDDDAGPIGTDDMVGLVVPRGEAARSGVPPQEIKSGQRLEYRRPDSVEVDRAGHHRDQHLIRGQLRHWHAANVQRLPDILIAAAREHAGIFLAKMRGNVITRDRDALQLTRIRSR